MMKKNKGILASTMVAGAFVMQGPIINAQSASSAAISQDEIRQFKVHYPDTLLKDLRKRVLATKWPKKETVPDETQGVQLATMQSLANYWATDYDWRKVESRLNALPQFITNIDGVDIHFIHVRSKHKNALPVIITHGWPGSIIEQMKIIAPLKLDSRPGCLITMQEVMNSLHVFSMDRKKVLQRMIFSTT